MPALEASLAGPHGHSSFEKPTPRPAKPSTKTDEIRRRNRRREYLSRNPDYLRSTEHELAEPLLYDSFVRKFQTAAEREAEGRAKGYSRVLEGDLLRGEARLASLAKTSTHPTASRAMPNDSTRLEPHTGSSAADLTPDVDSAPVKSKVEGRERWDKFITDRFVLGLDDDFDYGPIDTNDEYDTVERQEAEEAWFDDEDPSWASDGNEPGSSQHTAMLGETGIQDF